MLPLVPGAGGVPADPAGGWLGLVVPVLLPADGEVALLLPMEPAAPELPDVLPPGPAVGVLPPGDTVLPGGQSWDDLGASLEPAPPPAPLGLEPVP
jgi:hypothetical protein